ncbi:MAG: serine hydrolase [Woeseiaceae bacterium]|nr:serine hydrolase [Woeseiaceae bacterium]
MKKMERSVWLTLTALAVSACGSPVEQNIVATSGKSIPQIDTVFADWDDSASPGCGIAVARDGEIVYSKGYGSANLDDRTPVTPLTVFDVASVTKQFTAASLTMLALDGKLSLDDDVRQWLPELPVHESPVALHHMIYHTSGLRDYLNLFPLAGRDDYYPISHTNIRDMMSRQDALNFQPGEQYAYSNTAYMLLAQVVERASGQSFGDFTQARIFDPLEMVGSRMYDDKTEIIPHRSVGYAFNGDGSVRVVHNYNFDVAGDGQLYSTMEDLLRWDNYLHGDTKPAIHEQMLDEGVLNNGEPLSYAQGLRLDEHRGLRRVGHSGSSWGFRTELVRYLDAGLSIAISCNFASANPGVLARQVAEHYLDDRMQPESGEVSRNVDPGEDDQVPEPPLLMTDQRKAYTGNYFSAELDAIYRVFEVAGDLVVGIEQQLPFVMRSVATDAFEFDFQPDGWGGPSTVNLDFSRDDSGKIDGFELTAGSEREINFTPLP